MAFPEELKKAFPSYGPDWDQAIERGVDVSLLLENLTLTPGERIRQLEALLNETERLRGTLRRDGPVR